MNEREFQARVDPLFILDVCEIVEVRKSSDSLRMVLGEPAHARLRAVTDSWKRDDLDPLVALRLEGSRQFFAIKFAADLGRVLAVFDFPNPGDLDALVEGLGVHLPERLESSSPGPIDRVPDSLEKDNRGLLEALDEEDELHEEFLRASRAGDSEKAEEVLRKLSDQADSSPNGS